MTAIHSAYRAEAGVRSAGARAGAAESASSAGGTRPPASAGAAVRPDDFEESVRVGRGILLGIGISLLGWAAIAAAVVAAVLLLR